jgi:hypothetical protein
MYSLLIFDYEPRFLSLLIALLGGSMGMLWLLVKQRRTQKSETDTSENHNWTQNKELIQGQLRTLALGSELEDRH